MIKMTTTKVLTYNNRRMEPGVDFEAKSHRDMKVILASRKAKMKREEGEVPAPPPAVAEKIVAVTGVTPTDTNPIPPKVAISGVMSQQTTKDGVTITTQAAEPINDDEYSS